MAMRNRRASADLTSVSGTAAAAVNTPVVSSDAGSFPGETAWYHEGPHKT
jgi:hypothetical protein